MFKNLFATHPIDAMPEVEAGEVVLGDAHGVHGDATLKRALTAKHLVMLGVGAVIGAGIFVLTGTAAAQFAGPALVVSFLMAGFACALAGLCYAEFSAMLPVSGSAYSYSYATLGEVVAWFVGWNLVLEYLFAASTVAVGWSGYFNEMLRMISAWIGVDISLPAALASAPLTFDASASRPAVGIESYRWSFSDGTSATGAVVNHAFNTAGDYTATVTVRAGSESNSATAKVKVLAQAPAVIARVLSQGQPLAGADVLAILADGRRISGTTNGEGKARLAGLPDGPQTIYAYAPGMRPGSAETMSRVISSCVRKRSALSNSRRLVQSMPPDSASESWRLSRSLAPFCQRLPVST